MKNEFELMDQLFDELLPITRSITGEGVRKTINILKKFIPLEMFSVKTGTKVFDWEIPKEWVIREAWIKDEDGNEIINMKNHNLHVLNYSVPVNKKMSLEELKPFIHTIPHLPDAIPYVTSYYKERWGFCMSYNQFKSLKEGTYHAFIDSELKDGELNYAHAILPGQSSKEILISTYICHPSMANNELSGPIVAAFLYNRMKEYRDRKFTYRFVFVPETIGSIAYLHRFGEHLRKNVYSGFVLTCLGGKNYPLSFKRSRNKKAPINKIVDYLISTGEMELIVRPFTPTHGSDERQYCSPGFNLPVGQFARMVYGQYKGYHNSLDTKEVMTIEKLIDGVNEIEKILKIQEWDGYYINTNPFGEVKLDKHGLYPDINTPLNGNASNNQKIDNRKQLNAILTMLNYSDGEHSLLDIAQLSGIHLDNLMNAIKLLKEKGLLKGPYYEKRSLFE
ncbi:DUF4910 domain-containing protein [Aeribacillus composti]|jgi:aminopeptidase-like protein|uniref:DUF4910 domain-containing protein n=1 Tax=Aeribacillus composti TaxID=1868734 RepID=A0ABY9WC93_9BACI|nr:DUF4910 domain-containing protein [Aeribacillus composti]WNF33648.1 DUF4910 domain-containing protein [Aeribacillus composti]